MTSDFLLNIINSLILPLIALVVPLFLVLFWAMKRSLQLNYEYYHAFRQEIAQLLLNPSIREGREEAEGEIPSLKTLLGRAVPRLPKRPDLTLWSPSPQTEHLPNSPLGQPQKVINILVDHLEQTTLSTTTPDFRSLANEILYHDRLFARPFNLLPLNSVIRWLSSTPNLMLWLSLAWLLTSMAILIPNSGHAELSQLKTNEDLLFWLSSHLQIYATTLMINFGLALILQLHLILFSLTALREKIVQTVSKTLEELWGHIHRPEQHDESVQTLLPQLLSEIRTLRLKLNQLQKSDGPFSPSGSLKKVS